MRFTSLFSALALASTILSAPVVQQEASVRDTKALIKRVEPIVNGAVYGGCQGFYVNIHDLGFPSGGHLVTDENVPLAAQSIYDSILHAPDPPNGSRTIIIVAPAGFGGRYRATLTGGESTAVFANPILATIINESLEAMRQQQRGEIQFTIRDEQHRIVFKFSITKIR